MARISNKRSPTGASQNLKPWRRVAKICSLIIRNKAVCVSVFFCYGNKQSSLLFCLLY